MSENLYFYIIVIRSILPAKQIPQLYWVYSTLPQHDISNSSKKYIIHSEVFYPFFLVYEVSDDESTDMEFCLYNSTNVCKVRIYCVCRRDSTDCSSLGCPVYLFLVGLSDVRIHLPVLY